MWSTAYDLSARLRWKPLVAFAALSAFASAAYAQSIATLKGRVTDASGAIVRSATITVRAEEIGVQRSATSLATGEYQFTFLPVGAYRVEIHAAGFRPEVLPRLVVEVGRTIVQDFQLRIGDLRETIEVISEVPPIERSITLGQIIDQRTLQDMPLNGRQLLQLALLVPGSITPPQNGCLTTPSRAQGSQGLNTAGNREDTANVQVNGVTLNDLINNIHLARNAVVGPGFETLDVSVSKALPLTSRARPQLQADVFNVLNHPNLGQPGRIVGSPNFGVIANTRFPPGDSGSSRQIQLGFRLLF